MSTAGARWIASHNIACCEQDTLAEYPPALAELHERWPLIELLDGRSLAVLADAADLTVRDLLEREGYRV